MFITSALTSLEYRSQVENFGSQIFSFLLGICVVTPNQLTHPTVAAAAVCTVCATHRKMFVHSQDILPKRHYFCGAVYQNCPEEQVTSKLNTNTVIHRLTKIIRSGIIFVSRNTHTDGKYKLLEWPDCSCLLLYVSERIH